MRDSLNKIWLFSKNRHDTLLRGLLFSFLRSLFGICQIFCILITISVLLGTTAPRSGILSVLVLAVFCVIGNFLTSYIEQINTMETGFFMTGDKRVSLAGHLQKLPLGCFTQSSAGRAAATLTTTLSGVDRAAPMVMVGIVSGLFSSLALLIFMLFYAFPIGILTGVGMLVYLLVVDWQIKVSRKNAPALQQAQTELSSAAVTFLQGIPVTKAFSFRQGDKRMKSAICESCRENLHLTGVSMPSQFAASLTIAVFESAILLVSLWMYLKIGCIDLTKTTLLILFSFLVYSALNQAGSMLSMIGLLDTGLEEAAEIEKIQPLPIEKPLGTPVSCGISLKDVSFSYGDREVLHHITTEIHPHTFTAIIGPSGSGKTTLCQLIARFQDVSSGSIAIGGTNIKNMAYEEIMARISMVFQHVYLFEDTILNNIRFGKPEATLEEVRAAAKKARCDDFIMALPQGYDTVAEEGGFNLSGGEKQRISIARALLKDAPIVILDEATSALDAENEQEILSAMDALTENKTVIMIAHRIQSVQKADHIIALKDGKVVQEGTHESLKDQSGLYKDFLTARTAAKGWQL